MMARVFRRPPRGGALSLIATFMILSAALRLGAETGPLLARNAAMPVTDPASEHAHTGSAPLATETSAFLAALQQREADLKRREMAFEDRMKALQIAGRAIDSRMEAMVEAEARLRDTLALADGAAERDLAKLTEVYEQMKPKETAQVFQQMAPEFAAGFLARMRSEVAAEVLAGMDPNAAYSVSVILAGRNTGVPQE